jgi:vacuolar protein sorting-associated protein 18
MTLYYASIVGDHERIITHWVFKANWTKALEALNKQVGGNLSAAQLLR